MYRYSVDQAVVYTPDDIALFRASPFAAWMERLTLENPGHGIPPDQDLDQDYLPARQAIIETLCGAGRDAERIDTDAPERERRALTLAAMQNGADFIIDGQLTHQSASGITLSGGINLLMRTSGYSTLGDFLYLPCSTWPQGALGNPFGLSCIAELLGSIQGQRPPQMLLIRGDADVLSLRVEDHVYSYRAVYQRFERAMTGFRKHRMPDPAESSSFGRWTSCANEILRQRAYAAEAQAAGERVVVDEQAAQREQARLAVGAQADAGPRATGATVAQSDAGSTVATGAAMTLAEQARRLDGQAYRDARPTGTTPSLAGLSPEPLAGETPRRRSTDVTLENLAFIGSDSAPDSRIGGAETTDASSERPDTVPRQASVSEDCAALPDLEPPAPVLLPPDEPADENANNGVVAGKTASHPLDSHDTGADATAPDASEPDEPVSRVSAEMHAEVNGEGRAAGATVPAGLTASVESVVDLDRAPPSSLAPVSASITQHRRRRADRRMEALEDASSAEGFNQPEQGGAAAPTIDAPRFNDSLITNGSFDRGSDDNRND